MNETTTTSTTLLTVPTEVWRQAAMFLEAPDVLSFLCVHSRIHHCLSTCDNFWRDLLRCQTKNGTKQITAASTTNDDEMMVLRNPKQAYLIGAYSRRLPSTRWLPIMSGSRRSTIPGAVAVTTPTAREGHIACVLEGTHEHRICIQGGFVDDPATYCYHVPKQAGHDGQATWTCSRLPHGIVRPPFVYGASWTALDENRAVRFGGFTQGGYSGECNDVYTMTLDNVNAEGGGPGTGRPTCTTNWIKEPTTNPNLAAPRAYHSATLIASRYLLIMGGMMWRESILDAQILDTHTWTWLPGVTTTAATTATTAGGTATANVGAGKPSGRHGQSIVLDEKRNRLVLFGGGSGTSLLRSGTDNSEVWELKMGDSWESDVMASFPWTWNKLHADSHRTNDDNDDDEEDEEDESNDDDEEETNDQPGRSLSPAESLVLGRCHNCGKTSSNTVLLMFGSGRPSTNTILGYDLKTDLFIRPQIQGPIPKAHFSGVTAFLESEGYVFVHGGYSSQDTDAIDDATILDVAPALNRTFHGLPVDTDARGHATVDNAVIERYGRQLPEHYMMMSSALRSLFHAVGNDAVHRHMVAELRPGWYLDDGEEDEDESDSDYIDGGG